MRLRALVIALLTASPALADSALPPWTDAGDVPMPSDARSVVPTRDESAIYSEPGGKLEARRGSALPGARFPLYATRRAPGCLGRWLNIGPFAWMCSDVAEYSNEDTFLPPIGTRAWLGGTAGEMNYLQPARPGTAKLAPIEPVSGTDDGSPYRYYFAGRDGAYGYANLQNAADDAPDQDLEAGFAVAIVEEQTAHGERWGRTKKGRWVAMRELVPARPNLFHGELIDGPLDLAWVNTEKANVFTTEKFEKPTGMRVRFEKLHIAEEKGNALRLADGGWMRSRDLARTRPIARPPEARPNERWIDVDLNQQVLTAYEGEKPVFATLVSSGKGAPGSGFETHTGTFRIWVKIFSTKMDNLDKDDVDRHYAIEDVPYVQFFDKAIALHGAFWHHEFGHVHSHGCVNMAPYDARWLFAFTSPHLPGGWSAVLPTRMDQGAIVRVR